MEIFVFLFYLLAQPIIAGHIQKKNTEITTAEINNFLCFILYFGGPIGVG